MDVGCVVFETEGRPHVLERLAPEFAGPVKVLTKKPRVGIGKVVPDEHGGREE